MGDRCWFEVYVRKRDAKAFRDLVFRREGFEADPPNDDYSRAVYYQDDEANYGYYAECEKTAKLGLVFEGRSGAAVQYGPARFCGIRRKFYHIETMWDGAPTVRLDEETREFAPDAFSVIHDYLDAYQRVRKALGARESRGEA